ncbi:serine hydrolase domain-containing protein [Agarilytica rhodophyticola]|uniref:serine hydrolase domain-containing protein n=1 Tax=Agarilytica rhodophyticola TaxID=1737490 RepID=UPI000B3476B8|nr:serine hydrolase domain-containing protein [Agarilytica rhodophyticola]
MNYRKIFSAITLFIALFILSAWMIYRDTTEPPKLKKEEFSDQDIQSVLQKIADATHAGGAPGVLLLARYQGKEYVASAGTSNKSSGKNMPTTHPLRIASVSKVYTAMVILELNKQGMFELDAPINSLLSDEIIHGLPNGKLATVRQLLEHSSGIPDYYDVRSYLLQDWSKEITLPRTLPVAKRNAATNQPGEKFNYSNMGYMLLGEIAERASGKTLDTLFKEIITSPLQLNHTLYNVKHPVADSIHGYGTILRPWADTYDLWEHSGPDGGMQASASDVARFLESLVFEHGRNHTIGSQMTKTLITSGRNKKQGMGLEVITSRAGDKLVGHSGDVFGYQTVAYAIPKLDAVFVGHINCDCGRLTSSLIGNTFRALEEVLHKSSKAN